jgi:hypothetical protein
LEFSCANGWAGWGARVSVVTVSRVPCPRFAFICVALERKKTKPTGVKLSLLFEHVGEHGLGCLGFGTHITPGTKARVALRSGIKYILVTNFLMLQLIVLVIVCLGVVVSGVK